MPLIFHRLRTAAALYGTRIARRSAKGSRRRPEHHSGERDGRAATRAGRPPYAAHPWRTSREKFRSLVNSSLFGRRFCSCLSAARAGRTCFSVAFCPVSGRGKCPVSGTHSLGANRGSAARHDLPDWALLEHWHCWLGGSRGSARRRSHMSTCSARCCSHARLSGDTCRVVYHS
jgi:hypothetical protein